MSSIINIVTVDIIALPDQVASSTNIFTVDNKPKKAKAIIAELIKVRYQECDEWKSNANIISNWKGNTTSSTSQIARVRNRILISEALLILPGILSVEHVLSSLVTPPGALVSPRLSRHKLRLTLMGDRSVPGIGLWKKRRRFARLRRD